MRIKIQAIRHGDCDSPKGSIELETVIDVPSRRPLELKMRQIWERVKGKADFMTADNAANGESVACISDAWKGDKRVTSYRTF